MSPIKFQNERIIIEYDDTTHAWNNWKYGNLNKKPINFERYSFSFVECTKNYLKRNGLVENSPRSFTMAPIPVPSIVKKEPEISRNCYLCHKHQGQLYPCRICGNVYHEQCLKDAHEIRSYKLIRNATKLIGWTCSICEDLRHILSPEELAETNEWIKTFGDQTIFNLDNYLNTRLKIKSPVSFDFDDTTSYIKEALEIFIHSIADMTSNCLSLNDLILIDVTMKIARMPPKLIVNSLTSFEVYRLSQFFLTLSSFDHNYLNYKSFHQIFTTHLQNLISELNSNVKYLHFEALTYSLFGTILKFDQTWTDFILNSTIPTLLSRYNHRRRIDFIHQIQSISQLSSPMSINLNLHIVPPSLTTLMNNVLHKLEQTHENSAFIKKIDSSKVK